MIALFNKMCPTHIVMVGYFNENFKWFQLFTVPCIGLENAEKYKREFESCGEVVTQCVILPFRSL